MHLWGIWLRLARTFSLVDKFVYERHGCTDEQILTITRFRKRRKKWQKKKKKKKKRKKEEGLNGNKISNLTGVSTTEKNKPTASWIHQAQIYKFHRDFLFQPFFFLYYYFFFKNHIPPRMRLCQVSIILTCLLVLLSASCCVAKVTNEIVLLDQKLIRIIKC
jgi:hypothetical protein